MKKQKHGFVLFIGLILLVLGSHQLSVYAGERVKVAILPLKIHAPENLDYLEHGLLDMLTSRTGGNASVVVLDRDVVEKALNKLKKDLNTTTAQSMAEELDADYIVSGSVTFFGGGGSIDFKVFARDPSRPPLTIYKVIPDIDNLLPEFSQVAAEINAKAFAARPQPVMAEPKPWALQPRATEAIPLTAAKTAAPEQRAQTQAPTAIPTQPTFTRPKMASIKQELIKEKSIIIPQVRGQALPQVQATPQESPWKSQKLDQALVGMALGDLFGDGSKELVAISHKKVFVYRYSAEGLQKLGQYRGAKNERFVWVSVADIDQNGRDEILVTSQKKLGGAKIEASSFALAWDGRQFSLLLKDFNYYLRAVRVPGEPLKLLGQKSARDGSFLPEIYSLAWQNNTLAPVGPLSFPETADIYHGTRADITGQGGSQTLMINPKRYLLLLDSYGQPIWRSAESYGATGNYIQVEIPARDIPQPIDDIETESGRFAPIRSHPQGVKYLYLPAPVLLTDLDRDNRLEVIVSHNLPGLGQLGGSREYSESEILSLSWTGSGMLENWRTEKIKGEISSLQVGDLNGDGIEELIVCTTESGGIKSLWRGKSSLILSYTLAPR